MSSARSRHSMIFHCSLRRKIVGGRKFNEFQLRRMRSYFRHIKENKDNSAFYPGHVDYPTTARIHYNLLGGLPGEQWAQTGVSRAEMIIWVLLYFAFRKEI
jgi:hypothetical protein